MAAVHPAPFRKEIREPQREIALLQKPVIRPYRIIRHDEAALHDVDETPFGNASGNVTITSYLKDSSDVFPSLVFVTEKLYEAVVFSCPQSIARLSETPPFKSIINVETCALSPPLEDKRFFAKETPLAAARRITKSITSTKTDLAPFFLFISSFLSIFFLR